ncbi:uncharacterized protein [Amphiura filiformis]|uniref:uncharacterized protein n=1 Tax=Amphiura filiformis TaxID=82378 RepID=UPI003B21BB3F
MQSREESGLEVVWDRLNPRLKKKSAVKEEWKPPENLRICPLHFLNELLSDVPGAPGYIPRIFPVVDDDRVDTSCTTDVSTTGMREGESSLSWSGGTGTGEGEVSPNRDKEGRGGGLGGKGGGGGPRPAGMLPPPVGSNGAQGVPPMVPGPMPSQFRDIMPVDGWNRGLQQPPFDQRGGPPHPSHYARMPPHFQHPMGSEGPGPPLGPPPPHHAQAGQVYGPPGPDGFPPGAPGPRGGYPMGVQGDQATEFSHPSGVMSKDEEDAALSILQLSHRLKSKRLHSTGTNVTPPPRKKSSKTQVTPAKNKELKSP